MLQLHKACRNCMGVLPIGGGLGFFQLELFQERDVLSWPFPKHPRAEKIAFVMILLPFPITTVVLQLAFTGVEKMSESRGSDPAGAGQDKCSVWIACTRLAPPGRAVYSSLCMLRMPPRQLQLPMATQAPLALQPLQVSTPISKDT